MLKIPVADTGTDSVLIAGMKKLEIYMYSVAEQVCVLSRFMQYRSI